MVEEVKVFKFVDSWDRLVWAFQLPFLSVIEKIISGIIGWVQFSADKGMICLGYVLGGLD
jgi:hypothetical protein